MDVVYGLDKHPVYGSLKRMLGYFCEETGGKLDFGFERPGQLVFGNSSRFIKRNPMEFSKNKLHIIGSPLVGLETWEALVRGCPFLSLEEYYEKGLPRDTAALSLLSLFKNHPFISLTKRTKGFLEKRGFTQILIPPAAEIRKGSKRREHTLFIGQLHSETKNPFLFLKIAERMKGEKFIIIGSGSLSEKVKSEAARLGNVEVIDRVESREELFSEYFGKAKALVHPAYIDPIGFVIIEALSASTPVIASKAAGASDFLPEEWQVGGYEPGEWAKRLSSALGDTKKAGEVFEKENLNIESPYFKEAAKKMVEIVSEHGWLA